MNLIEAERLVRKITDVLQNHAPEAQARPLAQAYAELCRTANHRLEQCAAMLDQGDEHQALQLAEAPPPVLELASRLTFREGNDWREFCRKNDLPVPDALEGRFIRQLNTAYGKGIAAGHELYRAYRQAVLLHRDEDAVKALRSIVWRNPADTHAPRELNRLERNILRLRLEELDKTLRAGDDQRAAELVEAIETLDFEARPEGEVWRRGQEARCRRLLSQAGQCRAEGSWDVAANYLAEVRALCQEHNLQLAPSAGAALSELEDWVAAAHKEQSEKDRFARALVEVRQMLARGEEQQMAGEFPDRAQLREQRDALRHKWREVELADRPVGEDLPGRVNKLIRLFEVRLHRLERRRRTLVFAGVLLFTIAAVTTSWFFWQHRLANDVAAELKTMRDERQVTTAEKRLAQIRSETTHVASSPAVVAAVAATDEFLSQERQRLQDSARALAQLQTQADHGFTNLTPEQIQARFDGAQRAMESLARDYQEAPRAKLTTLLNQWDLFLDTRRNERAADCEGRLRRAEEVAGRDLAYERGPEVVRAGLAALDSQLRELQPLIAPTLPRLAPPPHLQAEFSTLQQRMQTCAAELEKWEQIQAAWRNPTSLERYLESLKTFQQSEFASPAEARQASEVLALNVSASALLMALLLPGQPEAWAQFQTGAGLPLRPDDVMPSERAKFRELRDDENIHNLRVFRRTIRPPATPEPDALRTFYLRGDWENTRSSLKRGIVYDPKESPTGLRFKRTNFSSYLEFEELGPAPESGAFETVGLRQLLDGGNTNYTTALLRVLDQVNREPNSSPLFRAWLTLRLHEMLELRPVLWGAPWSPAVAADRLHLRALGAENLRSGDWLIPARQQEMYERLQAHFRAAGQVSYLTQARLFHSLARQATEAGFALAGHVDGTGKPALAVEAKAGSQLWGWSLGQRRPALLFRLQDGNAAFTVVSPPLPFSPLLVLRADRRELLAKVKQSLGPQSAEAGTALPPLFAAPHE